MESTVFDRETLLDLLVNVIPLGILLFFVALFLVDSPFGGNPIFTFFQYAILVGTFVSLVILTYYSGRAVATDEKRREGTSQEELPPGTVVPHDQAEEELPESDDASDERTDDEDADDEDEAADEATPEEAV